MAAGSIIGGIVLKTFWAYVIAVGLAVVGILFMVFATYWANGQGEAKVFVNSVDRSVQSVIYEPAQGFKAPWIDTVQFDLFAQELVYAGKDEAPSYTGGTVNGREITVSVGGVNGGSTQGWMDATFVYNIDGPEVEGIYNKYKSQERFTKMIIEKQVLSTARQVPSSYSAINFRGVDRAKAEQKMLDLLNGRLSKYGVEFSQPTIQDVRYPKAIEKSITAIEQANQAAQKAEADQRTATAQAAADLAKATGDANAKIEQARGEAEANRLLAASVTPEVVELKRIEALALAAKSGQLIIDGGQGNLLLDAR
jgi:regulator of protease activity HflC (stomatin/prohibitin superfamily)